MSFIDEKTGQRMYRVYRCKENEQGKKVPLTRKGDRKLGRNDQCPCASGKKYKHCHGR